MRSTFVAGVWFACLLLVIGCDRGTPPPGYSGAVPSGAAQQIAKSLSGKTFKDAQGQEWTVGGFMVGPRGPVITLTRPGASVDVYLDTDGDVADLYEKVTGGKHPTLSGALGERYPKGWPATSGS